MGGEAVALLSFRVSVGTEHRYPSCDVSERRCEGDGFTLCFFYWGASVHPDLTVAAAAVMPRIRSESGRCMRLACVRTEGQSSRYALMLLITFLTSDCGDTVPGHLSKLYVSASLDLIRWVRCLHLLCFILPKQTAAVGPT